MTDWKSLGFYGALVSFTSGIVLGTFFDFTTTEIIFLFSLSGILFGIVFCAYWARLNLKKSIPFYSRDSLLRIVFLGIVFISATCGIWRISVINSSPVSQELYREIGKEVSLQILVDEEGDSREFHTQYSATIEKILNGDTVDILIQENRLLIFASLSPVFKYGDRLEVKGVLKLPENFSSDSGKEFDYVSYLAKDKIFFIMERPAIRLLSSGNGNPVKTFLFNIKNNFLEKINKSLPKPESSLLAGLVVGAKQTLGKNLLDQFRVAGLSHVIVLSGYNITILIQATAKVLSVLPRVFSFFSSAVLIILFAIMVGGGATIIRASVMALIAALSVILGRRFNMTRALFLAGVIMLVQNPSILFHDLSFQLSFLATFSLVTLSPIIEKYFLFITEWGGARSIISTTIATQIFVLPLLLFSIGNFSIIAPFSNILVLPFIPMTMLFGFLTGLAGFINYFVSLPFAFVSYLLLSYEISIVKFFASLPGASIGIPYFPVGLLLVSYVVLGLLIFLVRKHSKPDKPTTSF